MSVSCQSQGPGMYPPEGCSQGTPVWNTFVKNTFQRYSLGEARQLREKTKEAYLNAVEGARSYDMEGIKLQRYDIDKMLTHFNYWCDIVNMLERFGTTNHPMIYKTVIPMDG